MSVTKCPDCGALIALHFPLHICKPKEEPMKSESKIKFFVEIYRGEEEGGLKTVEFEKRKTALEFADRQARRGYAVQVHTWDGKVIFDSVKDERYN